MRSALIVLVALPLAAQAPPSDAALADITARGRALLAYDIAAWHGGDAIQALKPPLTELNASFARVTANGKWEVVYGRLTDRRDTFYVSYRALQVGDSQFDAARLATPLADIGVLRDMAVAFQLAQQDFGKVNRPYNAYILPSPEGGWWAYLLPAQTDPRNFPLGGDVRYRIVNGVIAGKVQFHRIVLDRPWSAPPGGQQLAAMAHTSFDSLPSETDVFVVLRRFPKVPEIVATRDFNFQIDVDGRITWVPANRAAGPAGPPATTTHIPVWKVKVDTVGSAPRIMSPGYTEWRDSTTGWRISLERTVDIRGADSASWNPTWRALALADGRVIVARDQPAEIQLYDVEGRFVREIGHQGTGPEEYLTMPTLAIKGDTLLAFDGIQSRMLLFALDGRFIRSFQVGVRASPVPISIDPRGYVRVLQRYGLPGDTLSRHRWLYYTMRGALVDSLTRPPLPAAHNWALLDGTRNMMFAVPMSPDVGEAFLSDGTLIYGTGDRYQLVATRAGRDTLRIFGRSDVPSIPIPPAFIDSTFDQLTMFQPLLKSVARKSDIPANYPIWHSITVDDKGYIWVSVGVRGRTPAALNVFAPEGRYLGFLPGWFDRLDMVSFAGDRIAFVGYDKDRRAVLRIYKLDRRGMN